ncbi:50S ribosomal protein L24 [Candidatus Wolfebacteria bacterium]|nr:50S ribosomal protein L24 [Candidatus Wolfebacteria bacterium]
MKFKKGDNVKIIAGKDKGRTGKILRVFRDQERILIEGINLFKKHVRPKRQGETGQMVSIAKAVNASNAMIVCSQCKNTSRIGDREENGRKMRYCKKCRGFID